MFLKPSPWKRPASLLLVLATSALFVAAAVLCSDQFVVTLSMAALPPLSRRDKMSFSAHVFTGKVWSIETKVSENKENPNGEWSNVHYRCVVEVEQVFQTATKTRSAIAGLQGGDVSVDETLLAGTLVYVLFWKVGKRPRGWTGDTGLSSDTPFKGFSYSFYTHYLGSTPMERSLYQSTFPYEKMEESNNIVSGGRDGIESSSSSSSMKVISDHSYSLLVPNGLGDLADLDPRRADRERATMLDKKLKRDEEEGSLEVKEASTSSTHDNTRNPKTTPGNPVRGKDAETYKSNNEALKQQGRKRGKGGEGSGVGVVQEENLPADDEEGYGEDDDDF